jgi:phosphoribosylformylglycinamidine synthase
LQEVLIGAAEERLLRSAHDLSDGGLAVALTECCIGGPWATESFGAEIDLSHHEPTVSDEGYLFGEDGARAIVSCAPEQVAALQGLATRHGVPAHYLGLVSQSSTMQVVRDAHEWSWATAELRETYMTAIPRRMAALATVPGGE